MKITEMPIEKLKEILRNAPKGATHVVDYAGMGKYDYLKNPDTWAAWYGSHWSMPGVLLDLSDKTIIKLSDIRARIDELEPVLELKTVFKVGDRVVLTGLDQTPDTMKLGEMDFMSGFADCVDIFRHATPEEEAAGHRIDEPLISDEMASPCPASDSATNQAEMDLRGNKTDSITERLNPAKCGKVNPSLAYDELCSPAPMVDGQLHAPIGQKHDQGKPRYSLIPSSALASIVDVLEYGATKYAPDGWKHVKNARERYYNASMRHIQSWWSGEQNDPETNLPHLAHAACSLMFLMWLDGEQGE